MVGALSRPGAHVWGVWGLSFVSLSLSPSCWYCITEYQLLARDSVTRDTKLSRSTEGTLRGSLSPPS